MSFTLYCDVDNLIDFIKLYHLFNKKKDNSGGKNDELYFYIPLFKSDYNGKNSFPELFLKDVKEVPSESEELYGKRILNFHIYKSFKNKGENKRENKREFTDYNKLKRLEVFFLLYESKLIKEKKLPDKEEILDNKFEIDENYSFPFLERLKLVKKGFIKINELFKNKRIKKIHVECLFEKKDGSSNVFKELKNIFRFERKKNYYVFYFGSEKDPKMKFEDNENGFIRSFNGNKLNKDMFYLILKILGYYLLEEVGKNNNDVFDLLKYFIKAFDSEKFGNLRRVFGINYAFFHKLLIKYAMDSERKKYALMEYIDLFTVEKWPEIYLFVDPEREIGNFIKNELNNRIIKEIIKNNKDLKEKIINFMSSHHKLLSYFLKFSK